MPVLVRFFSVFLCVLCGYFRRTKERPDDQGSDGIQRQPPQRQPLRHAQAWTLNEPFALEKAGGCCPASPSPLRPTGDSQRRRRQRHPHLPRAERRLPRRQALIAADDPGWWDIAVGPGKPIDTDRYFVICPNMLGGCRGTTGPNSLNPADRPALTAAISLHHRRRHGRGAPPAAGTPGRRATAGGGGRLPGRAPWCLTWAARHPGACAGCIALATSPRLTSQALAFDVVGRNAILRDPDFHGGQYYDGAGPRGGSGPGADDWAYHLSFAGSHDRKFEADRLAPARCGHRFEKRFSVGSYLGYQGEIRRTFRRQQLCDDLAGDGPVRPGRTPQELAAAFAATAAGWSSASPATGCSRPSNRATSSTR